MKSSLKCTNQWSISIHGWFLARIPLQTQRLTLWVMFLLLNFLITISYASCGTISVIIAVMKKKENLWVGRSGEAHSFPKRLRSASYPGSLIYLVFR